MTVKVGKQVGGQKSGDEETKTIYGSQFISSK